MTRAVALLTLPLYLAYRVACRLRARAEVKRMMAQYRAPMPREKVRA